MSGVERASCTMTGSRAQLVGHLDEAIASAHVVLQQIEQRARNRPRLAVANRLTIPFDDRRDFD